MREGLTFQIPQFAGYNSESRELMTQFDFRLSLTESFSTFLCTLILGENIHLKTFNGLYYYTTYITQYDLLYNDGAF
jgi:hypothetical protein